MLAINNSSSLQRIVFHHLKLIFNRGTCSLSDSRQSLSKFRTCLIDKGNRVTSAENIRCVRLIGQDNLGCLNTSQKRNTIICCRSIHNSKGLLAKGQGSLQSREERKNIIFFSIIAIITLACVIFHFTMERHQDYVIVGKK